VTSRKRGPFEGENGCEKKRLGAQRRSREEISVILLDRERRGKGVPEKRAIHQGGENVEKVEGR